MIKLPFYLILAIFICMITGCAKFYSKYYTDPELYYTEALAKAPFDAVIVTGFPYNKGGWNATLKARVYWGIYLYEQGMVKNIIFSGSAVYSPYVESKIMALYAQALGIPENNIFIETKAEHSTENLYYSYKLAQDKGFKTIALATDVPQSSFIKSVNNKFGLDVQFIPMKYDLLKTIPKIDPEIDEKKAFEQDFVSIIEREKFRTRLQGTRGKKIKKLIKQEKTKQKKSNKKKI
ncbi:MAG: YdcF family protein [Bacteroidetes bacterium]|nr:YdcF family protein [Bacteroidota bacterium]HET6243727.1 YdcF family protein [Bacteroidia bacterium]